MNQKLAAGDTPPHLTSEASDSGKAKAKPQAGKKGNGGRPGPGRGHGGARRSPGPGSVVRSIRINSPASLLAVVPYLLTFQPSDSMVLIGTDPACAQIRLTLRYDLPDPPEPDVAADLAAHAIGVLSAQRTETAVAVGYGPGPRVTPVADAIRAAASQAGIRITELLRAENERYWSYLCADPACCPPDGTPYTVDGHPAAAVLAASGARVLASRDELTATLAPLAGEAAQLMSEATRHAEEHAARLVARLARTGRGTSARRLLATAGVDAVREAVDCYRREDQMTAGDAAAWLTVVLRDLRVRDDAWARMLPEHRDAHLRLWTDITRLARPGYVAAPAALLAFVAWQSGNGALANVALDRALADNPGYSMAQLLRQAIDSGAPPSMARLPMTPEDVAASYEEAEGLDADDSTADSAAMDDVRKASDRAGCGRDGASQDG